MPRWSHTKSTKEARSSSLIGSTRYRRKAFAPAIQQVNVPCIVSEG